jgi:hypothetical protein
VSGLEWGLSDDRDGDVRAVDGAQAALSAWVPDAGGGGAGLDSPVAVMPDQYERAGARRVDGPQADETDRIRGGVRSEITRALIEAAVRQKRFRPRSVRIDSPVSEADVTHPTNPGLASAGVRSGRWRGC